MAYLPYGKSCFCQAHILCPVQSYRINPCYLFFGGIRLFEYLSESGKVGVYLQEGFTHLVLIVLKGGGCTHASLVDLMQSRRHVLGVLITKNKIK